MKVIWHKVTKKELSAILRKGNHTLDDLATDALHISYDGITHDIYIPYHASTRLRLHELGHAVNGHMEKKGMTFGEWATRELQADAFVYDKIGKPYDIWMIERPIWLLTTEAGCRPCHTIAWVTEALRPYFTLTRKGKSKLWHYIVQYYNDHRKTKRGIR